MKLLFVFVATLLSHLPPSTLLVIDKDMRKPPSQTTEFSTALYMQRNFPLYAADVPVLVEAIDEAVKEVDKLTPCAPADTINAAHTTILIRKDCEAKGNINVTLITEVVEMQTSYSFSLVKGEDDVRKAQRRLLDFATYISQ
jgi:hypothetical protein